MPLTEDERLSAAINRFTRINIESLYENGEISRQEAIQSYQKLGYSLTQAYILVDHIPKLREQLSEHL